MEYCIECKEQLTDDNWYKSSQKDNWQLCKFCYQARYRKKHNPEKHKIKTKTYDIQLKQDVVDHYGEKCQCCGETNLLFLTIDHIQNDGALQRKTVVQGGIKFYAFLRKNNYPDKDKYRVLCFNCNCAIGAYGFCPHNIAYNDCCYFCGSDNIKLEIGVCSECIIKVKMKIENPTIQQIWSKNTVINKRIKIFNNYGKQCQCCMENKLIFLTIDHIVNDGDIIRGHKLYRWLIKNEYPTDNFQLLCYNCNCAKGFYGKCPHQNKNALN